MQIQADLLEEQLYKTGIAANSINADGYKNLVSQVQRNSKDFRDAANSTGAWEAAQVRVKSAADSYTEALQKQQLSMRQLKRHGKVAAAAYREQLKLQQMVVRQLPGRTVTGKEMADFAIPTEVHESYDTAANRLGFFREQMRSASTQMINWGKNTQWAGRQLMVGFTIPVVAFGAAAGAMAYQVEKELTRIAKVYDTTADANNTSAAGQMAVTKELTAVQEAARATAVNAARDYAAAGKDTLSIQADLAAMGLTGARLQESTSEIMRIATLGEMEHADALNASNTLMSVFNMTTRELTESFNYMNSVENATSLQLADFAKAIPIAAAPVKAFGGDVYELGVLLTAMRENGIQAVEGANALKAAMQRLGRPSKQIQEEFAAITGTSITELVDTSDSLTEVFTRINAVTKDLSDAERRDVFAGLFGSYQVTRMMALTEGMDKLSKGVGQVSDAARIAQQDTSEWAAAADRELERMMSNPAYRFKAAVEEIKLALADFGKPFLSTAAFVIESITWMMNKFNELPGVIKKALAFGVIAAALVGPIVMLVGLFANFAGNIMKFGVAMTGLLTKFELLDRESAVARASAALAEQGFVNESTAVQKLTHDFRMLAASMMYANEQQGRVAAGSTAQFLAGNMQFDPATGQPVAAAYAPKHAGDAADETQDLERNTKKMGRNWGVIAANTAAAAAMLTLFVGESNESMGNMGQMLMYAALFGPALYPIGGAIKNVASRMAEARAATGATTGLMSTLGTKAKGVVSRLAGIRVLFNPVTAGVAAVGLSLVAIHDAMQYAGEQQRAINDSAQEWVGLVDAAYEGYKNIGQMDGQPGAATTDEERAREWGEQNPEIIAGYKDQVDEQGENNYLINEYNKMLRTTDMSAKEATDALRMMLIVAEGTAYSAGKRMAQLEKALGRVKDAAGTTKGELKELDTALETALADHNIDVNEEDRYNGFTGMYEIPRDHLRNWFRDEGDAAEEGGKELGDRLGDIIKGTKNVFQKGMIFTEADQKVFGNKWGELFDGLDDTVKDKFAQAGITTAEEYRKFLTDFEVHDKDYDDLALGLGLDPKDAETLRLIQSLTAETTDETGRLLRAEEGVAKAMAYILKINGEALTLEQLRILGTEKQIGRTKEQARERFKEMKAIERTIGYRNGELITVKKLSYEDKLRVLNQERVRLGLRETTVLADKFGRATKVAKEGLSAQAREIARINALMGLIDGAAIKDLAYDAMSGLQQGIADDTMEAEEAAMAASMERVEAAGEARMDAFEEHAEAATRAMERRHENAQIALENRQESRRERIEKSYDTRIDKINDAIEAEQQAEEVRQRIFDAEMKRLDRLNEAQNRNIDFNVALNAGDLDEAAKIRNDMQNQVSQWALEDAADRGGRKSDRRVGALEDSAEAIEKRKEAALKNLDDIEEAERRSLERRQEREQRFLEKRQEIERKALEASIEATVAAEQKKQDARREMLEEAIEDFTRYVAKDAKDLRNHVKTWKEEHKGISLNTERVFDMSTDRINRYLVNSIKDSRRAVVNEMEWEADGEKIAKQMIKGAFGLSIKDFKEWMVTGKWPNSKKVPDFDMNPFGNHEGGFAGTSHSRKGVARNTRGLHPNEVMVRAQKGEFITNRRSSAKYGPLLEAINNDSLSTDGAATASRSKQKAMGGAGGIHAGLATGISGLMLAMIRQGINTGIQAATWQGAQAAWTREQLSSTGAFGMAKAGSYAGVPLDREQIANAMTIANVGKNVKASARDIKIALITAMTESALRNVNYGDRDSLGLFQQRAPWGSVAERTNPEISAKMFFTGGSAAPDGYSEPGLFDIKDRDAMSMGQAAQAVQVSAYPDRYATWVAMANALFTAMQATGSAAGEGYIPGAGGGHKPINYPVSRGLHGEYTGYPAVDISAPRGSKVYAVGDGKISRSYDIPGPLATDDYDGDGPYGSYGRVVYLKLNSGPEVLYAHLNKRSVSAGQTVKGGSVIGYSGNTGNSSGPHLHFGATTDPYDFTGLKKGAAKIKVDDQLFRLHRGEGVLTEELNAKFHQGVENFASGPSAEYHLHMTVNGNDLDEDVLVAKAMRGMRKIEARRPGSRRVNVVD